MAQRFSISNIRSDPVDARKLSKLEVADEAQKEGHGHSHAGGQPRIATVAYMIIFGDGLHRLVDGLSIGAVMALNPLGGVSLALAILCEEIPHTLGDIAIMVNSGLTLRAAIGYNLLSHIMAFVGLAIGIVAGQLEALADYVLAGAAGMFMYIALTTMV